jgi:hypothetical protein
MFNQTENTVILDAWNIGKKLCLQKRKMVPYQIGDWYEISSPSYTIPPMTVIDEEDIDLKPFLIFDVVIMNKNSLDFIKNSNVFSKQTRELFNYLEKNNNLKPIDYENELKGSVNKIFQETEKNLSDNNIYKIAIESTKYWRSYLATLKERGVKSKITTDTVGGVDSYIKSLMEENYDYNIIQLLRHQLWDVWSMHELHLKLKSPIYFWQDYNTFYAYNCTANADLNKILDSVIIFSKLWTLYLPNIESNNPDKFIKILENNKIKEFRQFINNLSISSEKINDSILMQVNEDILSIDSKINKYSKIVGFIFLSASLIDPFIGVAGTITNEILAEIIKLQLKKKYNWHFFLKEAQKIFSRDEITFTKK